MGQKISMLHCQSEVSLEYTGKGQRPGAMVICFVSTAVAPNQERFCLKNSPEHRMVLLLKARRHFYKQAGTWLFRVIVFSRKCSRFDSFSSGCKSYTHHSYSLNSLIQGYDSIGAYIGIGCRWLHFRP